MTLHEILNYIANKKIKKIDGVLWTKTYNKLIEILYMVGTLTETSVDKIIAKLDNIDTNGGKQ